MLQRLSTSSSFRGLATLKPALRLSSHCHRASPCASAPARSFHRSAALRHENPLKGIPRREANPAPKLPRRGGPPEKSRIKGVNRIIVVASGKGGVGKSTVAANLALALAQTSPLGRAPRIGLLDLDIFGPSIPKLMGLESAPEPALSDANKLLPMQNHGIKTMSMGYLIPQSPNTAVAWRGLMVQKAVQQLLFDVDWAEGGELDALVVDMPPGTGDVQLTLGQLVSVDGSVIVSTPQDVALIDARKGVAMFHKVNIPIIGLLLNMSHYTCEGCEKPHEIFGSSAKFAQAAKDMGLEVLGKVPLVTQVSDGGDDGRPVMVQSGKQGDEVRETMKQVGAEVWDWLEKHPAPANVGVRG